MKFRKRAEREKTQTFFSIQDFVLFPHQLHDLSQLSGIALLREPLSTVYGNIIHYIIEVYDICGHTISPLVFPYCAEGILA